MLSLNVANSHHVGVHFQNDKACSLGTLHTLGVANFQGVLCPLLPMHKVVFLIRPEGVVAFFQPDIDPDIQEKFLHLARRVLNATGMLT